MTEVIIAVTSVVLGYLLGELHCTVRKMFKK